MGNRKYTNEDLIQSVKNLNKELGRAPMSMDFKARNPDYTTYFLRFGSWENVLKLAGIKREKHKSGDYTDDELINALHTYHKKYNKVPTTRDLKADKTFPSPQTYANRFGSYKDALIKSGLYELRKDKSLFDRHEYTKEEILDLTIKFIKENNRVPVYHEFNSNNKLPSTNVFMKYFENLNELIIACGYDPLYPTLNIRTNEQLIEDLQELFVKLGRAPTSRDIDDSELTASVNAYVNRFGSVYKALEAAGITYKKRTKFLSDEEVISIWYELKERLNRVPTIDDMYEDTYNVSFSISQRWGSYSQFLNTIGENGASNKYGSYYFSKGGIRCLSRPELLITNWLEDNGIHFQKDYPYKNFIKGDDSNRTLDWYVLYNDKEYYIEYFGIIGEKFYDIGRTEKIEDSKRNNINLIGLYPKDMKRPLNEVFSFLQ